MPRGKLRIYLGAAPGVGTTCAMLEEGHRLRYHGRDVVIGLVETHGRTDTADLMGDLEVVPRRAVAHRGNHLEEMDLQATLARNPEVALVDDLAHTNVLGSGNERRWQDVARLLEAGVDVVSTLDIRHLESLTDVIASITGMTQQETIPDDVVRSADEIELVDLTQEGIRERLAAGKIYPADQIDAALANYFRPGNLSALRELALSWTADRVDEALARYRQAHGIDETWETRERVVVALAGARGGEAVVRRAARVAMRARSELIGVYVRPTRSRVGDPGDELEHQRRLLVELGGTYHEVVGDDVGEALLAFARAENATQIVLGASRRSRLDELLRGSPIMRVMRRSGPIDVHVISYEGARPPGRAARRRHPGIDPRRRLAGWATAAFALPLATIALLAVRDRLALHSVLLVYLLIAVGAAGIGGTGPAVATALAGFLLGNWYFTPPFHTWTIDDPENLFALVAFLVVASLVGVLVAAASRQAADARRARAQAEALAATAGSHPVFGEGLESIVRRLRATFALDAVSVLQRTAHDAWEVTAGAGAPTIQDPAAADETIELGHDTLLALRGGRLAADDRRVLRAFAAQAAQALEREELQREAAAAEAVVQTDRLRTAFLGAVSHDLRTPLASIKASVTSLLETGVDWTTDQTRSFLETVLAETERLNRLVGQLLDASRLQVGAVHVFYREIGLDEVVASALAGVSGDPARVQVDVAESLPLVKTDPALLERVVANLVDNALASAPELQVTVTAGEIAGRVDMRIVDHGTGIPATERDRIFQPFQRLGDTPAGTGVGLGLAVSRGFLDALGHELLVEDTPGGGTTMVISLKVAP
ncbi:MAG: DUF4118 domain-containing protein [Acidimicrobiia bacterium]